jgi:hypothetical protein
MPGAKKKRSYRKSTPIGRLQRNVDKVSQHAALLKSRVSSWGPSPDGRVSEIERLAGIVLSKADALYSLLVDLEASGFVAPEKPRAVTWEEGQRVAVGQKFREKYEAAFQEDLKNDGAYLDELVVESVLPSGEVVVRRKRRSPFLVPKTHLVEAEEESGG